MAVKKVDLRNQLKYLYSPSPSKPETVDVPEFEFVMIDGKGDPNAPEFANAVDALYSLSYTIKFAAKKRLGLDYQVLPLEGLWWGTADSFDFNDRASWSWTALVMQPEFITSAIYKSAVADVKRKKGLNAADLARFEEFHEGLSAQIMHVGPYSSEGPTIRRLHDYIAQSGGKPSGKHHEIYLGDPRRAAPAKLKTVLRQPFEKRA